jgi:ribose transport system permease protein
MTEARPVEVPPADEQGRVEQAASATVQSRLRGRFAEVRNLGLVGVLVVLAIVGIATTDGQFLTRSNILNILVSASIIGVVTVGMTFVIIGGGIDLSVGALVALASVWATTLATQSYGAFVMVICALLVGMGAGLVNGVLIAYGRLVPFIVTLAMLVSARGLAQSLSDRHTQLVTVAAINDIATTDVLGIPLLVYIFAAVIVIGWLVLNRSTFGRRTFAVGGNPEAARLAGIDIRRHTALLYVVSGLCCGIAAVMIMARTTTGSSTHGDLYELDAIAAVIIGGTLLTGGRGTLIGSILGVLVFTTITNLFVLNNLPTEVQNIAKGLIIVAAVLLQRRGRTAAVP